MDVLKFASIFRLAVGHDATITNLEYSVTLDSVNILVTGTIDGDETGFVLEFDIKDDDDVQTIKKRMVLDIAGFIDARLELPDEESENKAQAFVDAIPDDKIETIIEKSRE